MQFWLCIVTPKNWEYVLEQNIWGVTSRDVLKLKRVTRNDYLIFYIMKEKSLGGIFKVFSERLKRPLVNFSIYAGQSFHHQIRIEPIKILKNPIDFSSNIRNNLKFITNKRY